MAAATKTRVNCVKDEIVFGLHRLCLTFVKLLNISHSNGNSSIPFMQARCFVNMHTNCFPLSSLFHSTVRKAILLHKNEDCDDANDELFRNLMTVLSNNKDIAKRLKKLCDKKHKTAYTVQLAHHLLTPLSVHKEYKMDNNIRNQIKQCVCCKEVIAGEFSDTSMGDRQVWHGSTDILIGKPDVVVYIDDKEKIEEEEEEDVTPLFGIDWHTQLDKSRDQIIAEAIVFGFLQLKIHPHGKNSLIPTIAISKEELKIYFYDANHDFLLESSSMPLFTHTGEELDSASLVALWLAVNYHFTCSGLTTSITETSYKAHFLNNFSEEIKDRYRNELAFGNCKKKSNPSGQDDFVCNIFDLFSAPHDGSHESITENEYKYMAVIAKKFKQAT